MASEEGEEIYGYYYGEEEDKGLLDPAWERQQKKVSPFGFAHSLQLVFMAVLFAKTR